MKRKGFTLIELLAVIVVLAIIALIATPMVLNTISKAREGAAVASANAYASQIEIYVVLSELDPTKPKLQTGVAYQFSRKNYEVASLANPDTTIINDLVDIKGDKPDSGYVIINEDKKIEEMEMNINTYLVEYKKEKETCVIKGKGDSSEESGGDEESKLLYKESLLNGADPVISGNLIAVSIASDGTVTKANRKQEWYSYEKKNWANAVVLFGEDTYSEGDIIEESAIKQYYVWIPRYKYELWNVNSTQLYPNGTTGESAINIVFESKNIEVSNGDENGEWLTHPAFTAFNTNGIWVGKYETSYNEETYTNKAKFLTSNPNLKAATTGTNVIIKPNVRSLTNKIASEFYTMSREVNSSLNSHMMKNSEWGAVSYLTYSNYGKCTNGVCEEVYINNVNTGYRKKSAVFSGQVESSGTITGCSGSSTSAGVNSNKNSCETGYSWNEAKNKASTTGNTSGIYDMNGGNWEFVMAVIVDSNGNPISGRNSIYNSGFNGTFSCPTCDSDKSGLKELTTGIDFPTDTRYYDLYQYDYGLSTDIWYDYTNGKLGDATKEIAATKANSSSGDKGLWYADYASFPSMVDPWFARGCHYAFGANAGTLCFRRLSGGGGSLNGFRVVLAY